MPAQVEPLVPLPDVVAPLLRPSVPLGRVLELLEETPPSWGLSVRELTELDDAETEEPMRQAKETVRPSRHRQPVRDVLEDASRPPSRLERRELEELHETEPQQLEPDRKSALDEADAKSPSSPTTTLLRATVPPPPLLASRLCQRVPRGNLTLHNRSLLNRRFRVF